MKIALVHDYLREYGGAESVLEALHNIFPEAPVYTAYYHPQSLGPHKERISKWDIKTSWLQKVPFANRFISPLRIIAPLLFQSFDLSEYNVVFSSSAIYFGNAIKTSSKTLHLAYIHTPPRYLYNISTTFERKKHNIIVKIGVVLMNHLLRIWDFKINQNPDILIANSQTVADRIKKFYRRDAVIIYPPVDINKFKISSSKLKERDYFLSICRLWKNKGVDTIIQACNELGLHLKVAGGGPELENLKKLAGKTIEVLGEVTDEEKLELYQGAKALIVAAEDEDFGITPVEAMACGVPVIAIRSGGFKETVLEGKTGKFFGGESLEEVLQKFDYKKYKVVDLQRQAEKFSEKRFKEEILDLIKNNLQG